MSSLVDSNSEIETSSLTTPDRLAILNESLVQAAVITDVTIEFVEVFVLEKPGDYCFTKTLQNHFYLSMYAESSQDESKAVHLQVRGFDDGVGIRGLMFARAPNLSLLLFQLKQNIELLSAVLEKTLTFDRLLTPYSIELHNIHFEKKVENMKVIERSGKTLRYTGDVKLWDGSVKDGLFEETQYVDGAFLEKFYDKLVTVANLTGKSLPIRLPFAAFLRQPTLIYEKDNGSMPLHVFLKQHGNLLDLAQRIKLCSSAVRVMSELHHCDVFHGAVHTNNFYANYVGEKDGIKEYELVFNGPHGLLFNGKSNCSVDLSDFDMSAPELSFTRKLSKESGVFNMGRLFEQILRPEIMKTYENGSQGKEPKVLREIRNLIGRATRANPYQRPTMHGVVMMIRETLKELPTSSTTINFIHFDQFPKN